MRHEFIIEYLIMHPCVDCGETNPLVLQFDHVNDNKKLSISTMVSQRYSLKTIAKEIEKCEVRCANCHTIETMKRAKAYPYIYYMDNYVSV